MSYYYTDSVAAARVSMILNEGSSKNKTHSKKEAEDYFKTQDNGEGVDILWVDEVDGAHHWLNDKTGEVVLAKEKEMPKGVKVYKASNK